MRWALRCLPAPPAQPELPQGPSPPPAWHSFCQVGGSVAVHLWAPFHCHQDNVKMMNKPPSHPCFLALEPVPTVTNGPSASAGSFQQPRLQRLGGTRWRFMSVFPRFSQVLCFLIPSKSTLLFIHSTNVLPTPPACFLLVIKT